MYVKVLLLTRITMTKQQQQKKNTEKAYALVLNWKHQLSVIIQTCIETCRCAPDVIPPWVVNRSHVSLVKTALDFNHKTNYQA